MMNEGLLLLDGATGTELNRRGVDTGLPLWSANALTTDTGLNVLRQIHLDYLAKPLAELRAICGPDFPLIAYGNIGYADEAQGWINTDTVDPESYLQYARTWPAQIVGGCCGTTPEHVRKLRIGRNHTI